MKLTTTAEVLNAALKDLIPIEKRNTLPILGYVRLQGNRLTATDLDQHSIVEFDGECDKPLDFVFPFYPVSDALSGREGKVILECIDAGEDDADGASRLRHIKLTHGTCVYRFNAMAVANFPNLPPTIPEPTISLNGAAFRSMIGKVIFAISREPSRYTLNGALLRGTKDSLRMVGTDGHRLSVVDMPTAAEIDTVVPTAALDWLLKRSEATVEIGCSSETIVFKTGRKTLITHTLKGPFPNYEAVIPKDENIKLTANIASCNEFREALKQVEICTDPRSGAATFKFDREGLEIWAKNETGSALVTLPYTSTGELKIGFSSGYLLDFLRAAGNVSVTWQLQDATTCGVLKLDDWTYLTMPMRI